ncbi:hypothetical protein [Candidatus Vampirococcus lugosii]|uniref:Primosomal protein n=1 Tax=Candidatus Vampirococcus lugosii TaxID=2789015 RepID=A0ABS5QKG6_9BACT|nr:hypothetical protein [Candidatus Vampirococcus lugosii]MBS8121735.1 primosomal protein [Candidatus Vampirococcus lugosii]
MNYELIEKNNKKCFLIDMTKENNKVISEIANKAINKFSKNNGKIAIIVNKKGHSSGTICNNCGFVPKCKNCDVAITYHLDQNGSFFGLCHICKTSYNNIENCSNCGSKQINKYGYGTEKIQKLLEDNYGVKSKILQNEHTNSINKSIKSKKEIKNINIIIGTSTLIDSKNIDFDAIIFLNADIGLNIPDYNSNYKNFLFIYDGINNLNSKNFFIQTFNPENHSIINGIRLDFENFKKEELKFRKDFTYPPYTQICSILYKDEIEEKLFKKVDLLYKEILYLKKKYGAEDIEIYSTPAMIYKMFGKYRYNIILKGENLREFMEIIYSKLNIQKKGFKIDWAPESIC